MRVSHEVPIALLKQSRNFNDYDYALVHLFDEYPEYYEFYKKSVQSNRHVLLDNSIFELGEAYIGHEFAKWIEKLRPTEYIIPDSLDNAEETIYNLDNWIQNYDVPGKTIGVAQGSTYEEFEKCFLYVQDRVDKVALSFDCKFYHDMFNPSDYFNKWQCYMFGRIKTLNKLFTKDLVKKPLHLLGCALPQEFVHYRGNKWIDTLDTSNPVVHGIKGIQYKSYGLLHKQSIKLVDMIEKKNIQFIGIQYNLKAFREFIK